jgi:predicted DNA-binding ribbon-helix-helix protein
MPRPQKRSVTLSGHRTSVTLEVEFWDALRVIAEARGLSINALIGEIDNARLTSADAADAGLSSAIRVYILKQIQSSSDSDPT